MQKFGLADVVFASDVTNIVSVVVASLLLVNAAAAADVVVN